MLYTPYSRMPQARLDMLSMLCRPEPSSRNVVRQSYQTALQERQASGVPNLVATLS